MDLFNAVLDLDLDSGRVVLSNIPDWLSDLMALAMGSFGRGKSSVDEAVALLESVELLDDIDDPLCPICYDSYADPASYDLQWLHSGKSAAEALSDHDHLERLVATDDDVHEAHRHLECERWRSKLKFNDPLMFFPVDELGFNYLRVPQRGLLRPDAVDERDLFPGYESSGGGSSGASRVTDPDLHIPMRIAPCRHVFGRLCLIEWFKNNLLCPLCRQQMVADEAETGVVPQRRRRLERDGRFEFTDRSRETEDLMAVTDVFAPPRRAPSTTVTPLTDLYVRQHWATPHDSSPSPLVPDPDIVMPQRFRGGESISFFAID